MNLPGQNLRHRGYTMDYLLFLPLAAGLPALGALAILLALVWPNS